MAAIRRTGYVWDESFAWHNTGNTAAIWPPSPVVQPIEAFENPATKARLASLVEVSRLGAELIRRPTRLATEEELLRVHEGAYLQRLERESNHTGGEGGDGETIFGVGSYEIARRAAGSLIDLTDAVLSGELDNGYALVRPPGHHAEPDRGRGYCLLANVPIAIEHARQVRGVERVAIVDYDVHHGNGAERIYWSDGGVLTISIHQDQLFPENSGEITKTGEGDGAGTNINIPLPAGSGHEAYFETFKQVVYPALKRFQPDLIMVSSGFDPSMLDPLGCMSVTSDGFRELARMLVEWADELCDGRLVFSHEGGYSAVYVPFCGLAVMEEISGHRTSIDDPFAPGWANNPVHKLRGDQLEVIQQAAELAAAVPERYFKTAPVDSSSPHQSD